MRCGQPATMRATSGSSTRRMRAATRSPAMRRSAAICSPTVQQTPGIDRLMRAPSASRASPAAWMRKPDRRARAGVGVDDRLGDRQQRLEAGERLADDAGEETRRRLVGLARPHHDGRQADADAVAEAAPGVVGEQQFADRLLRAVGGQRREMEIIGDRVRRTARRTPRSTRCRRASADSRRRRRGPLPASAVCRRD